MGSIRGSILGSRLGVHIGGPGFVGTRFRQVSALDKFYCIPRLICKKRFSSFRLDKRKSSPSFPNSDDCQLL